MSTPIIKEVTTRTVVIGRQNKVVIGDFYPDGNPCLWVDFPKGADEIRAAALTMLQIADVLEGRE